MMTPEERFVDGLFQLLIALCYTAFIVANAYILAYLIVTT